MRLVDELAKALRDIVEAAADQPPSSLGGWNWPQMKEAADKALLRYEKEKTAVIDLQETLLALRDALNVLPYGQQWDANGKTPRHILHARVLVRAFYAQPNS